jgi:sigma-B regulation protein RsbU (phosphoserine phosphatase)
MELARDNERQFFVTAVMGRLDLRSGALTYVSAGHPPPLRASTSGVAALDAPGGAALGIIEEAVYHEGHVALAAGDVLLIFTDGVTDAVNGAGALFSDERLQAAFGASAARPASEIVPRLVGAVNTFAAGAPQEDDITVVALRFRGPDGPA